jgi:cell division protein FtsQ
MASSKTSKQRLSSSSKPPRLWRRAARLGIGLGLAAAFGILMLAAGRHERGRRCSGVDIVAIEPADLYFLDPAGIRSELGRLDADTFSAKPLASIALNDIEAHLESLPHVAEAEAWIGAGDRLRIRLQQRVPVLRVMHSEPVSYYLDIHGEKLPTSPTFTARVPVVTGIPRNDGEAMAAALDEVLTLAALWQDDPMLEALVEQIHRNQDGSFVLVPKIGDHVVLMGQEGASPEEWAPGQWDKLRTFYRDGLRHTGWEAYRQVDLRYRRQVVARR